MIAIGGDGTFHGCEALAKCWSGRVIGCPGTIDNDLMGTDFTIGFATAVQTAVEAVDKIRDTAESHERMFLVEVMGRHSGFIAVHTALACAAETVCIPETPTVIEAIVQDLHKLKASGKGSIMMIVTEGGGAQILNDQLNDAGVPFSTRVVILGHLQRGGCPAPADRILASELGAYGARTIAAGETGTMAGRIGDELKLTPFADTYATHKPIPQRQLDLLDILAS